MRAYGTSKTARDDESLVAGWRRRVVLPVARDHAVCPGCRGEQPWAVMDTGLSVTESLYRANGDDDGRDHRHAAHLLAKRVAWAYPPFPFSQAMNVV